MAAGKIEDLSGIYLDIDPRNNLEEVDKLCRGLINKGGWDQAIRVASAVNDSLPSSDNSKNRLFLPDVMRKVAKKNKDPDILNEAIKLYEEIIKSKPYKRDRLAEGKLEAAENLLRELKVSKSLGETACSVACDKIN